MESGLNNEQVLLRRTGIRLDTRIQRAALFLVTALFIVFGPSFQQVFGRHSPLLRAWTMYEGYGINIYDITFHAVHPDGTRELINWQEALRSPDPDGPRRKRWRINGAERAFEVAKALKKQLPPTTDLKMSARVSTLQGWMEVYREISIPTKTSSP